MASLSAKICNATNHLLKEGEEIKAVGQFRSGWHPFIGLLLAVIGGGLGPFTFCLSVILLTLPALLIVATLTKIWYVAVTNKRVIFIQLTPWGKPDLSKSYSVPISYVQLLENGLSVQPVSPELPRSFRFEFGAKSVTGLDKSTFVLAFTQGSPGPGIQKESMRYSAVAQPYHPVASVEQQEEAKQRKRRTWGWVFVIGSGLFTLMSICQTIAAIAYSFSSSAAEAVQKSGIIAIVAPLGCNALWLVLWGVLLGLSIKNLRSIRQSAKPTQYLGQNSCQFCGKRLLAGRGIVITGLENAGQAAQQMLARKCECITCGAVFCLECGNAEGYKRGTGATHCPKCGTQVPIEQLI